MVEACGYSIPDRCYYGCPEFDFGEHAQTVAGLECDAASAREAGLSGVVIEAIDTLHGAARGTIEEAVSEIPRDPTMVGPWKPDTADLPRDVATATPSRMCCRRAGIVLIGGNGRVQIARK